MDAPRSNSCVDAPRSISHPDAPRSCGCTQVHLSCGCTQTDPNHFSGLIAACGCEALGVRDGNMTCVAATGLCFCKPGVSGRTCSDCGDGFFGLLLQDNQPGVCKRECDFLKCNDARRRRDLQRQKRRKNMILKSVLKNYRTQNFVKFSIGSQVLRKEVLLCSLPVSDSWISAAREPVRPDDRRLLLQTQRCGSEVRHVQRRILRFPVGISLVLHGR